MKKISINTLRSMKKNGEKFSAITAYDYTFSHLIEAAAIEVALVGDSLGNVILGHDSTIPVTVDEMAYHTSAVKRGNNHSLLVSDMPFMSYATEIKALENAATLMRSGAQMVKLEGGEWLTEIVYLLSQRGIPVCGHVGLTPQSVHKFGGFKVQGRAEAEAKKMIQEAIAIQDAGADLIVVECVPSTLGTALTAALDIPVIGIGAGASTDAQVLVLHDMLGISKRLPKFSKDFLAGTNSIQDALKTYSVEVSNGSFPGPEHCCD